MTAKDKLRSLYKIMMFDISMMKQHRDNLAMKGKTAQADELDAPIDNLESYLKALGEVGKAMKEDV